MSLVVNTNISSSIVQRSLNKATNNVATALERLSTGYKINSAADDAAGLSISEGLKSQAQGATVSIENAQHGANLLQTAEGDLGLIQDNLQRIRDLTVQAANGTYSSAERKSILNEVKARFQEITRIANTSKFNKISLLDGKNTSLTLQIGGESGDANRLNVGNVLVKTTATALSAQFSAENLAKNFATGKACASFLSTIDSAITKVSSSRADIGAYQNRLESTLSSLDVKYQNLQASYSQIRDTDIASETANLTKNQILQQVSVSLLAQANQAPSIALSLI